MIYWCSVLHCVWSVYDNNDIYCYRSHYGRHMVYITTIPPWQDIYVCNESSPLASPSMSSWRFTVWAVVLFVCTSWSREHATLLCDNSDLCDWASVSQCSLSFEACLNLALSRLCISSSCEWYNVWIKASQCFGLTDGHGKKQRMSESQGEHGWPCCLRCHRVVSPSCARSLRSWVWIPTLPSSCF